MDDRQKRGNMDVFGIIAFAISIILCVIAIYSDVKFGKIRNKMVIRGIAGFVLFVVVYYALLWTDVFDKGLDYKTLLTNIIFTIGLAFSFWYMGYWRGGDAKLSMALGMFGPFYLSSKVVMAPYFPSLILFAGYFLVPAVGLLLMAIAKTDMKTKFEIIKNLPSGVFKYVLFLFGASWIVQILFNLFGLKVSMFTTLLLVFAYAELSPMKLPIWALGTVAILRAAIDKSYLESGFGIVFGIMVLVYLTLQFLVHVSVAAYTNTVHLTEVEPRMVLSVQYAKQQVREMFEKEDMRILTPEDIEKIKGLPKDLRIKELPIAQQLAFAPFFLVGTVVLFVISIAW